jgi:ribosomal protein L22
MSPRKPRDPQKASADEVGPLEDVQAAQEAAEAKPTAEKPKRTRKPAAAESESGAAKPKRTRKKPEAAPAAEAPAADTAAAETKADKEGAVAAKASESATAERPARAPRRRRAAAAEPPAPAPAPSRRRSGGRAVEPAVLVSASAKYVRTSARKARLVCDHIRGKDVQQARAILAFTPRGVARDWSKLLESAVANAEHNHELVGEELRIHSVVADEGPTLKRFRPRAMGRATRIRKRTSHLTITLTPKES